MKHLKQKITVLLIIFSLCGLNAQSQWGVEVRPGFNIATKDLGDIELNSGFGFETLVDYQFMEHLAVYAGWGWNKFTSDQKFKEGDLDFEETGYTFGLQFIHPIGESDIKYLIRGGGIYNHIEVENSSGDIIEDTGHGLGLQIETGVVVPLSKNFNLMPSVMYRSLSRDIALDNSINSINLNYVSIGLGLNWSF